MFLKAQWNALCETPLKPHVTHCKIFGTSLPPHNHSLHQTILSLHQLCKLELSRRFLVLHKKHRICSFDSNFWPVSDWFTGTKRWISHGIKCGLQEAVSRISQTIFSGVARGKTSRSDICLHLCQQRKFWQYHVWISNFPMNE